MTSPRLFSKYKGLCLGQTDRQTAGGPPRLSLTYLTQCTTVQLTQVPVSHYMFGMRANASAQVDHEVIEPFYREGYVILEHVAVTAECLCDPLPQGPQHLGQ